MAPKPKCARTCKDTQLSITDLPLELILRVVKILGLRDKLNVGQAQKAWQQLLKSPQVREALPFLRSFQELPGLE